MPSKKSKKANVLVGMAHAIVGMRITTHPSPTPYVPIVLSEEEAQMLSVGFREEISSAYRMMDTHGHDPYWRKRFEVLKALGKRLGVEW